MQELIEKKGENYESSAENAKEAPRLEKEIQKELADLQKNVAESQIRTSFFEKRGDTMVYNMDLVKQYLQSCLQKNNFQLNSTVVMAVQIALESLQYDVGVIDGILGKAGSNTRKAVRSFQEKWNEAHENNLLVKDGIPGKNTIGKILQVLENTVTSPTKTPQKSNVRARQPRDIEFSRRATKMMEEARNRIEAENKTKQQAESTPKQQNVADNKQQVEPQLMQQTVTVAPQQTETKKVAEAKTMDDSIQPKFRQNSNFYLQNRNEYIKNNDILLGPKLQATSSDQIGGIGSSMMLGFSGYGRTFKNMDGVSGATTRSQQRYRKKGQIGTSLDEEKLRNHCENKGIKSFVIYFGGNEAAASSTAVYNAYDDVKVMGECLESFGVQPVLCTCIGEKKPEHSVGHKRTEYPLVEYNQKIRDLGKEKNWPVIDYAKIDVGNVWYSKYGDAHPGADGYIAMGQKIKDNMSV